MGDGEMAKNIICILSVRGGGVWNQGKFGIQS